MKYSDFIMLVVSKITPYSYYSCHALKKTLAANPQEQANADKLKSYIKKLLKEEDRLRIIADPERMALNANAFYRVLEKPYGVDFDTTKARIDLLTKYAAYHRARGN